MARVIRRVLSVASFNQRRDILKGDSPMPGRRLAIAALAATLCLGLILAVVATKSLNPGAKPDPLQVRQSSALNTVPARRSRPVGLPTPEAVEAAAPVHFADLPYEGTRITPLPSTEGETLTLHQQFAEALNSLDPKPEHRLAHFQWLLYKPSLRHRGWIGNVASSIETGKNTWRVTVNICPLIDHRKAGKIMMTGDYVQETYEFDGKNVRYVSGVDPPDAIHSLLLP